MNNVASNIAAIRARIPASVQLVAVSKNQNDAALDDALKAGQRLFGENKVQEAYAHWEKRRAQYPDLRLHLIGPLQTNKADDAVALFDVIETLDRPKLVDALMRAMKKQSRLISCFIQVNIGAEEQKAGVDPAQLEELLRYARAQGLSVTGLMCIPPVDEDPVPYFKMLRNMAQELNLPECSMGMSADYERAIEQGATIVRVGTALFGVRS